MNRLAVYHNVSLHLFVYSMLVEVRRDEIENGLHSVCSGGAAVTYRLHSAAFAPLRHPAGLVHFVRVQRY